MVSTRPMIALTTFTFPVMVLVLLFFSTCCLARPSSAFSNYRRAYNNYIPRMMADFPAPLSLNNPWELAAQEPLAYDQPEEDPFENNLQWMDIQALSNLLDAYDKSQHWGRIVNEMPEEYPEEDEQEQQPGEDDFYAERQLAELKRSSNHPRPVESVKFRSYESRATTTAPVTIAAAKTATKPPVKKLFLGQKEIPLLRPPNHPRVKPVPATMSTTTGAPQVAPANGIVAAQLTRSTTERQKKPSPYDTLREYLSIEDQIKKEAAKRRMETRHENVKRSSRSTAGGKNSNFVADEATLTGQLSSLRKSVA